MDVNFTDLVVLIGTNPLPNYVVIKYFLKQNKHLQRIWLIYSEKNEPIQSGTRELADNIEYEIKNEFKDELEKLGRSIKFEQVALSNVGSAQEIIRNLKESLDSDSLKESRVHLNYTGGTKSMAVHTYQYFYEIFKGRCSFSYLDGRDFRIKYDGGNIVTDDLRKIVGISLDRLYRLHGCKPSGQQNNPVYQEAIEKFKEIICEEKLEEFFNWKNKNIKRIFCEKSDTKKKCPFSNQNELFSDQDIEQLKKDTEGVIPEVFYQLLKTLPSKKAVLNDSKQKEGTRFKVVDFLNGKWLESYVYDIITDGIENDKKLRELRNKGLVIIGNNQEIKKRSIIKPFEIDVMILNGYQVCGISCTTGSKEGECKNKGFEIIHRVRQMGGDEAKSILVTCISDNKKMNRTTAFEDFYEDLKDITGSASHEFLVLGLNDLKPDILWKKIRRHIWGDA